jgi:signal transduction histidine kinase
VIGSTCATSTAQTNPEVNKVLLLFTHESHQPAQIILEDALRSTLVKRSPTALEIYSDYLDGSRTSVDSYESAQVELLQRKYGDKKFDLVVAINPPALSLVVKNRSALFSNAPIVFLLLEQRNLADLKLDSNVTGLWAESNYRANLDLALALQPGTKRVVVISGAGPWDNYFRSAVQEDFRPYEGKLQFDYLSGLTVSELQTTLSTLPAETVVSFVSSSQDRLGNTLGNLEVLRQICPVSNSPIYGSTDAQLGLGIVGGQLTSFEDLGEKGAELAIRILTGEKPDSIAPHGVKGVAMFDWRALQRWNIGEQNLPAGSTIRFKQLSFWELYKWRIAGLLGILLLQSLLIAILLIERNRRRRAKESLDKLNVELEQRIVQRTEALDAKSRELETFAYSVAHDLKAPLRGIDGYSRLLLEDHSEQLDAEGQTFLSTIQSSAEEMSQLIDDLLSYSRLERRDLKPELLPLKPLITKLVEHKKRELNDRDIDFVLVVNGGSVLADVNGLTQSLNNYLDNAIKFTQKSNRPRIEVGAKDIHHKCVLWVKDNGIGFDPKFNERIFDIFQRLNQPEDYPGTGVGLAIVRKAMERSGGRAWAVGTPGEGATFYLEIPHQEGAIDKQFT